jgi:hypothetical protein
MCLLLQLEEVVARAGASSTTLPRCSIDLPVADLVLASDVSNLLVLASRQNTAVRRPRSWS